MVFDLNVDKLLYKKYNALGSNSVICAMQFSPEYKSIAENAGVSRALLLLGTVDSTIHVMQMIVKAAVGSNFTATGALTSQHKPTL